MNEKERAFDNFMKSEGGIYLPTGNHEEDQILDAILISATRYIEEIRMMNPKLPKANIYYVNNNSINACAFKLNSEYFIAINTGAVLNIKMIFDTIFNSGKLYESGLIKKAEASNYSPKFVYFAMMFLVVHEYSHIRFGHCDLIEHLWGKSSISELTSNNLINDGIFRQTLEYDADCCTIANITNRLLMIYGDDVENISEDIGQWMLACYILFKVFDGGNHTTYDQFDLDGLAKSSHPRPGMRQDYLMKTIVTLLISHFSEQEVDSIMIKVFGYLKIFEESLQNVFDLKQIEMGVSYTKKGDEHLITIANNWEKVRGMLEPYTHDNLAPFEKLEKSSYHID